MLRGMLALVLAAMIAAIAWQPAPTRAQSPTTAGTTTPAPSGTPTAPPPGSPTPVPAGTPWPAPGDLRVTTVSRLLDENGFPLRPEQQEHRDVLTWGHLPGFTGEYEVEVSLVPFGGGSPVVLQPYIRFPAEIAVGMAWRVSQYPEWLNNQRCYRIRTTIPSGTGSIETGPFSVPACTLTPPSSGPVAVTPVAPGTGTGTRTGPQARGYLGSAGVLIALAGGSAAAIALSVRRRPWRK